MIIFYIFIFIFSILALYFSSKLLVGSLTKIAQFFGLREFIFAFFVMAFAGSLPNLFVGISSIIHGIPSLALGEIIGGNIVDLTIAIALAALISKNGLTIKSRTVQGTAIFTLIIAILPLLLIADHTLSRVDGIILLLTFFIYIAWLFSKQERYTRVFDEANNQMGIKDVFKNFFMLIIALILLFLAAEGVVSSAIFFANTFNMPLFLIGILLVGAGNALPETFFGIQAARKGDDWMVVGGIMGAVIGAASLVLGIVALISPITLTALDVSLLVIARIFLIIAAISFLLFIRVGNNITKKEGIFLLIIYLIFVLAQILIV